MSQQPKKGSVKLSHKLEYACRVLAQLARFDGQEKLAHIDVLAEAESIPANYLVQILNELRNANLIISKRGKQGGYALARKPAQIGLNEIVRAIDPEMFENNFRDEGHSGSQVAKVWGEISGVFEQRVNDYTLEALIVDEGAEMYYI